jgi:hypothetical protein
MIEPATTIESCAIPPSLNLAGGSEGGFVSSGHSRLKRLKMSEILVEGQQCNKTKGKNESSQVLEGPGHLLLMNHAQRLKI